MAELILNDFYSTSIKSEETLKDVFFQSLDCNKQKYPPYSAVIASKAELKGTARHFQSLMNSKTEYS